ncbi:MAG: hypothetical protein ABI391_05110 [Hyphomicrobiaceae bacterium]
MNVTELKAVLHRLEELYVAGGASAAAKDLRSIAGLLEGHEDKSLDAFIDETRSLLDSPKGMAPAAKPAANDELVASYSDRLLAANIDQSKFDPILAELDKDKRTSRHEWYAIANRYRNAPTNGTYEIKFKSIQDARKTIRDTFIERHEAASKRGVIERLTKWAS